MKNVDKITAEALAAVVAPPPPTGSAAFALPAYRRTKASLAPGPVDGVLTTDVFYCAIRIEASTIPRLSGQRLAADSVTMPTCSPA